MALVKVLVPKIGGGLQEIRIVRIWKLPGEHVLRHEPVYELQTDGEFRNIESPCEGILRDWLVGEGDVVPTGAGVVRIDTTELSVRDPRLPSVNSEAFRRNGEDKISPGSATPDPWETGHQASVPPEMMNPLHGNRNSLGEVIERHLRPQQQLLVKRLRRSQESVVPATMSRELEADVVDRGVTALRGTTGKTSLFEFELLAYCVAQAVRDFPMFRSRLLSDSTFREFQHLNLGIAVARENDDLVTAVIPAADALDVKSFVNTLHNQVRRALAGQDQATSDIQLILSYLGSYQICDGVPILVAPAVGVLMVGSRCGRVNGDVLKLCLTFEHRLINGVSAANFLNAIAREAACMGEDNPAPDGRSEQPSDKVRLLTSAFREQVGRMLNRAACEIDPQTPLASMGLTSLKILELGKWIEQHAAIDVSPTVFWRYPTIERIATYLMDRQGESSCSSAHQAISVRNPNQDRDLRQIRQLSEEEAEALLLKELNTQDARE